MKKSAESEVEGSEDGEEGGWLFTAAIRWSREPHTVGSKVTGEVFGSPDRRDARTVLITWDPL